MGALQVSRHRKCRIRITVVERAGSALGSVPAAAAPAGQASSGAKASQRVEGGKVTLMGVMVRSDAPCAATQTWRSNKVPVTVCRPLFTFLKHPCHPTQVAHFAVRLTNFDDQMEMLQSTALKSGR